MLMVINNIKSENFLICRRRMESGIQCLSHGEGNKTRFTGIASHTVLVNRMRMYIGELDEGELE